MPIQIFSQLNKFDDHFRAMHLPFVRYIVDRTLSGTAQMVIEFSSDLNHVNATVVTPVSGYEYVQLPLHQPTNFEGISVNETVMSHPVWQSMMDNTRFSMISLYKAMQGQSSKSFTDCKTTYVCYLRKYYNIQRILAEQNNITFYPQNVSIIHK